MFLNDEHLRSNRDWVNQLLSWYDTEKRDFPWRRKISTYQTWICEVMSQQTTLAVVVPRFELFVEKLPTLESLASVSDEVLRELWAGLGYYARARNLRSGARYILEKLNGVFPETYEGWLQVPGVGPYTASVIVSICYGVPKACVDGNVVRVAARLAACASPQLWSEEGKGAVQDLVDNSILEKRPGDFNQAMMELGATVCQKQSPQCAKCPVADWCLARQQDVVAQCPQNKPRKSFVDVQLFAICVSRTNAEGGEQILLVERTAGFLSGTLGFPLLQSPNSQKTAGHLPALNAALQRVNAVMGAEQVAHTITHHRLSTHLVRIHWEQADGHATDATLPIEKLLESCSILVKELRWVSKSHVRKSVATSLDRKIWEKFS